MDSEIAKQEEITCSYLWITVITVFVSDLLYMFNNIQEMVAYKIVDTNDPVNFFFHFEPSAKLRILDDKLYYCNGKRISTNFKTSIVKTFSNPYDYDTALANFGNNKDNYNYRERHSLNYE